MNVLIVSPELNTNMAKYFLWSYYFICRVRSIVENRPILAPTYPLSLPVLGGLVKHYRPDFSIRLVDHNVCDYENAAVPDLIFMSTDTVKVENAIALARNYKKRYPEVCIVVGGPHFRLSPLTENIDLIYLQKYAESFMEVCDSVVFGSAEYHIEEIIADVERDQLPKMYYSPDIEKNAKMTFCDLHYDGLLFESYLYHTIESSRGCTNSCDYCSAAGNERHFKQPIKVIENIKQIRNIENANKSPYLSFFITDNYLNTRNTTSEAYSHYCDLFNLLKDYKNSKYLGDNLSWDGHALPHVIEGKGDSFFKLMSEAGCQRLLIGFENLLFKDNAYNRKVIKTNELNNNFDKYREVINVIRSAGIDVIGSLMLNSEMNHDFVHEKILQFIEDNHLTMLNLSILTPYPGSKLFSNNMLCEKDVFNSVWSNYTAMHSVNNDSSLECMYSKLLKEIYSDSRLVPRLLKKYEKYGDILGTSSFKSELLILLSLQSAALNYGRINER